MSKLTLISSPTCPYVQRVLIALKEKQLEFGLVEVDLANKPDWFLGLSPLGKVPVLKVERENRPEAVLFESTAILDYLEDVAPGIRMLPADPIQRARHRGWIAFASSFLDDIRKFATARTSEELEAGRAALSAKLKRLESCLVEGPYFAGQHFGFVDCAFAPAFRRLDVIESANRTGLLDGLPRLEAWRRALAARPSVAAAAPANYADIYLSRLRRGHALILKSAA